MNIFTRFSLKNVVVVFLIIAMIVAGGIYSTGSIQQEAMPNISFPVITTSTLYVGAAPEDVAEKISRPLQKAFSGIQGVESVKTISNENISIIVSQFSYSKDMDKAQKEIEDAINRVTLPENAGKPLVSKISMGGFPIMTYSVESTMNSTELAKFVNDKVKPSLSGVPGVSSIDVQGIKEKKVFIKLDNDKLNKYNLTSQDIEKTLNSNNISIPAGQINVGDTSMPVKISSTLMSINDLKAIPFVILPNQTKLIGESMGKVTEGMTELGLAVGKLSEAVATEGEGMAQLGQALSTNTQAIALLNVIQKYKSMMLVQQSILANPESSNEQKMMAAEMIKKGELGINGAQQGLDSIINNLAREMGQRGAAPTNKGMVGAQSGSSLKTKSRGKTNDKIAIKTVFLKDIAAVSIGEEKTNLYTRADLKDGMIINVYKNDDANTVAVASEVRNTISELSASNKKVTFSKIEDSSDTVKSSVEGMLKEGFLGALFAVVVIALFLRDVRATVIAVVSIPLSILIALILLPRLNITINMVTLAGITVAIGRIVDDSIVVIENIYRRVNEGEESSTELIESASREVSSAITSSTITTVAVFLPLGFVSGIIGKFFVPFAVTVVICILASLLVAVTVVPLMCKLMIKSRNSKHGIGSSIKAHKNSRIIDMYTRLLALALKRKMVVIIASVALMVISLGLVYKLGVQFMPSDTTSVLEAKLSMPPGTSVTRTNKEALEFEKYLVGNRNVKTVVSSVGDNTGSGKSILNLQGSNGASLLIVLKDGIDYDKAAREIEEAANNMEAKGESIAVRAVSSTGQRDNFSLIVKGSNMKDIEYSAGMIMKSLRDIKELTNLTNNLAEKKKEIAVEIDNEKAAKKGLSPIMVAGLVRGMMTSAPVMILKNEGKDMEVVLGFKDTDINSRRKIENLKISVMGISFRLKEVAKVSEKYGPVSISELDGNQYASITGDISGSDTQTISTNALARVDEIKNRLPKDITYSLGGSARDIEEGFSQMGLAMAAAVVLVYLVMVLAFGEATAPFAILFSLPFAAIGAIFALFIAGEALTMPSLIGMLMLIGIVVTNAIVLLDRVQSNRKRGMSINDSLIEAGSVRLRPIFMTAIATVMALMPLALGFSKGTVLSQGLGIVVIGGLTLSTLLTLIIVPVIYASLEGFKEKRIKHI